ncbi:MAG TPA: sigma-70 family RNA polymerase sigma factor [Vicinamibacterales bacterium]|nr:sigma-70 family RNA polymerase sigma factor [Vicinamibacterales bacterium]
MPDDVTLLLHEWRNGSREALDRLIPLVYAELRALAARHLSKERPNHTLQTTALVHEAYVKLVDQRAVQWQNRAHFFGIAAQLMRRIVVDDARHRLRDKRGAGIVPEVVDDLPVAAPAAAVDAVDALALDRALQELEKLDPEQARIVELRFFGGLTLDETATVLDISPSTVKREWAIAKGWLYRALTSGTPP